MTAEDEPIPCDTCNKGRVTKRREQFAFRQMSNKGHVYCCVEVLIGTCDYCHAKSIDDEEVLDEAYQREYDKLP